MRLPTVISAGSQPTRRRQRPRLDPAALTRSDGLLPLRCTASWPRPDVRVAHLAGELDMGTAPFRAEYLGEQTATRPAELVLDVSEVTLVAAAGPALIVTALRNDDGINGRLHLIGVAGTGP